MNDLDYEGVAARGRRKVSSGGSVGEVARRKSSSRKGSKETRMKRAKGTRIREGKCGYHGVATILA